MTQRIAITPGATLSPSTKKTKTWLQIRQMSPDHRHLV
jgi:hypothetical protein